MAPDPAGVGAGCRGGRRPRPTSCQRRAPPRPQAPRSPAPPPPLGSAPAGSTPPRARGPANHVSASGSGSQNPPSHSHALSEARPQPPRRSRPEQEVLTNHDLAFFSDSKAPPLLTSPVLRLRPEAGPAQNALSWQPRFLGTRCPGGGANPARWLRPFGTSKCLSACVPGLFLSRANLLETVPHPSNSRRALTVPKPLPETAAQQSWSSPNVLALRLHCRTVQAVRRPRARVRPEAGDRSPQTRRNPGPDCG